MNNPTSQRWERYEQALLTALGCAAAEGHPEVASYRLLTIPTFHPICACEYVFNETRPTLRVASLPSVSNPLFDYFYGDQSRSTEVAAIEETMFSTIETTVALADPAQLRQRFLSLTRPELDPDDVAARDGAMIRIDQVDHHGRVTLRGQVGLLRASTALAAWATLFLDTALERIDDRRLLTNLKHARQYLLVD